MAGLTHTIGGVAFSALNSSAGRKSLGCFPQAMNYSIFRFHSPGTSGNYVVRGGRNGGTLAAQLRYVDTLANVHAAFQADRTAWEDVALTIVDSTSTTFTRCSLDNHSMKITRKPLALGRGGLVFMDAAATFTVDS